MPEDLPTTKKSLKQLEKENNRQLLREQKIKALINKNIYSNTQKQNITKMTSSLILIIFVI